MPIPDRAVLLAMRPRRPDPYAEAPTELFTAVDEVAWDDRDDDTAVSPSDEGVLVPVDDAPAEEDTSWGTPAYGRRPVPPVTAADIHPPWATVAPDPDPVGRPVRAPKRTLAQEDAIGALAVWTLAASFASVVLVASAIARFVAG